MSFRGASTQDHSALFKEKPKRRLPSAVQLASWASKECWTLAQLEQYYIEAVLKSVNGNAQKAAALLGINRLTIARKRKAGKIR